MIPKVEVDFGAAVGAAAFGVVFAGSGQVGPAGMAFALGNEADLGRVDTGFDEEVFHGGGALLGEVFIVFNRCRGRRRDR